MSSILASCRMVRMLQFSRIRDAAHPQFAALWQLYERSFPLEEQRPYRHHAQAMACEEGFVCMRLHDDEGLAGLLFYWELPQGCLYLEHLAVCSQRRGQGIGHQLMDLIASWHKPVILEIEPVVDISTQRRLRFYQSCGYVQLPYAHVQLPFRRGAPCAYGAAESRLAYVRDRGILFRGVSEKSYYEV